jgi:predicted transcriptional regulator of viral defense system
MGASNITQNVRQGLSNSESLLLASLSAKGKKIFTLKDVQAELNCSYSSAKDLTKSLVRKKWIINLIRGVYLIVPLEAGIKSIYTEHEFVIGSHLISPYYIAYWSALNFHNLTEQTPFTIFVATTKRAGSRQVLGLKYRFVTLYEKKFFGFTNVQIGSNRVNISDLEKTLADAFDHPEYCGGIGEVSKCLWNGRNNISLEKLISNAKKMGNSTVIKRAGFLLDSLGIEYNEDLTQKMRRMLSSGMSILDPTQPRRGHYSTKWNLFVNVKKESFTSWEQGF